MATMISTFLLQIYNGMASVPVFDLGINFAQLLIGCFVISISIIIFKSSFSLVSSVTSRIGRNVRKSGNKSFEPNQKG